MSKIEAGSVVPDKNRRNFLKGLAAAGGAATLGAAAGAAVADSGTPPPVTNEPQAKQGYRVTAHILDYYRTAGL